MKRPYIIPAEEQVVPTVKKFFDQRDENQDYIVSTGIFPADKVNVISIPSNEAVLKACTDLIEWYYNDFDGLCGFNTNSNPDKKERLLVDEVNANNESTRMNFGNMMMYIQSQLDDVNKYLGTDIRIVTGEKESNTEDGDYNIFNDTGTTLKPAEPDMKGDLV